MLKDFVHKVVLYIKDAQEFALFTAMTSSRVFQLFTASPLFYMLFPFLGLLHATIAIVHGIDLYNAPNKNVQMWLNFLFSLASATFSNIWFYGALVAQLVGTTFVAGPWFFLLSIGISASYQLIMLGVNAYRAFVSLSGSTQRMHHIQAAFNNFHQFTILGAAAGAVFTILLVPAIPYIGAICASFVLLSLAVTTIWRMAPNSFKTSFKDWLGFEKPKLSESLAPKELQKEVENDLTQNYHYSALFTPPDYSEKIKALDLDAGRQYLIRLIDHKLLYSWGHDYRDDAKTQHKKFVLESVLTAIGTNGAINKHDLLTGHELAFQSFWHEKGDVEQLVDAAVVWLDMYKNKDPILVDVHHLVFNNN